MKKWMVVLAILASVPAFATTYVGDPYGPGSAEPNLYELSNLYYGTDFNSSTEMEFAQITTQLGDWLWDFSTNISMMGVFGGTGAVRTINVLDLNLDPLLTVYQGADTGYGPFGSVIAPDTDWTLSFTCTKPTGASSTWYAPNIFNVDDYRDHLVVYDVEMLTDNIQFDGWYLLGWDGGFGATDVDYQDVVLQFSPLEREAPVPEPTSLALMGIGLAGLAFRRFRNVV